MISLFKPRLKASTGRRDLGKRIIAYVLLVSAGLSLVASGVQLVLSYQRDRSEILTSFDTIQSSFQEGLENALWEFNFQQVELLLNGLESRPNVAHISLTSATDEKWRRGTPNLEKLLVENFELVRTHSNGSRKIVGRMVVGLTLENAKTRVTAQFWTLLLTNFVKAMVSAIVMLAILERLLFRHLRRVTQYVYQSNWLSGSGSLHLDRRENSSLDDLGAIVQAINISQEENRVAYESIQTEISERQLAQDLLTSKAASLVLANAELKQSNKEQAEFAYAISHDLKSPTSSTGMLLDEILIESKDVLNPDAHEMLDQARQIVDRMGIQIDSVLNYSRSITKTIEFNRIDLNQIIKNTIEDLNAQIKEANVLIVVDNLDHVAGDASLLSMLFLNLLSNAIKFRVPDRTPEIGIRSRYDEMSDTIYVSISDNGIGIAEKYKERIFGLFKRLHLSQDYPGSGIGLALCQRIVTKHGGIIEVESEVGHGTTIQVSLRSC